MPTPDEIKKGLECCGSNGANADVCPYMEHGSCWDCYDASSAYMNIMQDALAYIQQLEADKEHLGLLRAADAEAYRHKLHELEALVPRWIPVEERLPENGLAIVCCPDPDRPVYIAWMCDGRWLNQFSRPLGLPVTHWMPLPEPPKEENHERCKEDHPD